jgi:hypothetical protein
MPDDAPAREELLKVCLQRSASARSASAKPWPTSSARVWLPSLFAQRCGAVWNAVTATPAPSTGAQVRIQAGALGEDVGDLVHEPVCGCVAGHDWQSAARFRRDRIRVVNQ